MIFVYAKLLQNEILLRTWGPRQPAQ